MKTRIYTAIIAITAIFLFIACQKNDGFADFEAGQTNTSEFSGEWFVKYYLNNEEISDYFKLETFNTAADNDSIWITDNNGFKTKAISMQKTLSFNTKDAINTLFDETITINKGNILKKIGKSASTQTAVDSINLTLIFSSDPSNTYIIAGHRRTGFLEDER